MEVEAERAGACNDKEWAARDRGCIFQALPCCSAPQEAAVDTRLREPGPDSAAGGASFQTDLHVRMASLQPADITEQRSATSPWFGGSSA